MLSFVRLTRTQRFSAAGVAVAGAAALTLTLVPGASGSEDTEAAAAKSAPAKSESASFNANDRFIPSQRANIEQQSEVAEKQAKAEAAEAKKKAAEAERKAAAERKAEAERKAAAARKAAAEKKAEQERAAKAAASRKAERAKVEYPNNLDGWIREARAIMKKHGIPGSYEGIKRNIMRESGGNPNAVNNWDINAINGTPSKGLLQTIKPTFDQYHVEGTANSMTDPVANIVAACNYAADRYGSMDNVDSAY